MTTAAELDRYRMPLPGPDTPVIPDGRVVALHAHLNTHYSASKWPLAPLIDNPSTSLRVIHWAKCPASLREEMRLLTWTMLNGKLRPTFVKQRRSRRARLGPDTTWQTVDAWLHMARWLDQRGIGSLTHCDARVLHEYGLHLRDSGVSRGRVVKLLTCVTRLWAFDELSARPAGIARPPWDEVGVDDYLPTEKGSGGENTREPLATQTMGPLLVWAMRMVDDFADDILAGWEESRRLTERARTAVASPETRAALHAYLAPVIEDGALVPANWNQGKLCFARSYVGGLTGASERQVDTAIERYGLTAKAVERPGPCPLGLAVTGRIAGTAWRAALDFNEAGTLMRHLGTASFIVCAFLTGMRPEEVLGMRSSCCPDPEPDEDGMVGRHLIRSVHFKTVTDDEGNQLPGGAERDVPWVAITPVVNAIRVLERMVPAGHLLFDHDAHDSLFGRRPSTRGALRAQGMRQRIEDFVAWANTEAEAQGLPAEVIPPDPHGNIGTARFRRTLAWHVARRPGGLVALAIQYGHMRTALNTEVSGGYGTRSRGGIHDVLALETALATAETAADLHDRFENGDGVSGPAARRALVEAATSRRFEGREIKTDFARKYAAARRYLARDGAVLYDNPHALLLCLYKHDRALCQREGAGDDAPTLDRCVPGCGNALRTDEQAALLRERAERIDKQAAFTPKPMGDRLRANADKLRSFADEHDETRFTRQEASA
ncbi:integrase [Streptomyces sp. NBC_01221]|uniref:integrase n=1 Tax=Streptomyces sp. NBC_01221 TaxID=2903782 RepID=UPI00224E4164|nr:integrase [Streptomyces sp. NBC_01221]MCX4789696.1 integrase [Streptomyces sp. NBC_01221]MCX4792007.1 integrase [Streptomyces sp. NBC_01221]